MVHLRKWSTSRCDISSSGHCGDVLVACCKRQERVRMAKTQTVKKEPKPYDDAITPKTLKRVENIRFEMESSLPHTLYGIDGNYYEDSNMDIIAGRTPEDVIFETKQNTGMRCEIGIYRLVDVRSFQIEISSKPLEIDEES